MKKKIRLVAVVVAAVLMVGIVTPTMLQMDTPFVVTAQASTKSNAKKAYKKLLSRQNIKWGDQKISTDELSFGVVDFDKDGVPELCVRAYYEKSGRDNGYYEAWSYKKGKVIRKDIGDSHTCDVKGYYPSKHVILSTGGYHDAQKIREYEKYAKGKTQFLMMRFYNEVTGEWYFRNKYGDDISKGEYNRLLKKYVGKAKYKKITFRKNTAKNRKKYLR